jgi:hypothetical protein
MWGVQASQQGEPYCGRQLCICTRKCIEVHHEGSGMMQGVNGSWCELSPAGDGCASHGKHDMGLSASPAAVTESMLRFTERYASPQGFHPEGHMSLLQLVCR